MSGNGLKKEIISSFESRDEFLNLLKVNPGLIIVKLGATWCGPCKKMLMYKKGNVSFAPDDSVTGADPGQLDAFFKRCGLNLLALEKSYAKL